MRKNKLNRDELKAMRDARNEQMAQALIDMDLDTAAKRLEYVKTCDYGGSVLLVASVDEDGYHMTSTNAVRYRPQDMGHGDMFLANGKDIYLRKDFLEAQGYREEDGWPVALEITMSFPTLITQETPQEAPKRKAGRSTKALTHADVNAAAVNAGLAAEAGLETPVKPKRKANPKAKSVIKNAAANIAKTDKPKKAWKITSAKARGLIKAQTTELTEIGVPEDDARGIVKGILLKKGYIVEA